MEYGKRRAGRARRNAVATIASLALAAGIIGLPAIPASASTCNVNTSPISDPNEGPVQDILDAASPGDTISFSGVCYGNFVVEKNLKLVGTSGAIIDGEADDVVFSVDPTLTVSFTGLTITNGDDSSEGGGLYIGESAIVTVKNMLFIDNGVADESVTDGGGIYADDASTVTVDNSRFVGNIVSDDGGAIYSYNARIIIRNKTSFTDNTADYGGALYLADDQPSASLPVGISGATFTGNVAASDWGGAIVVEQVPMTVTASTFTRNTAAAWGGAIAFMSDDAHLHQYVTGSTFTGNVAGPYGGAISLGAEFETGDVPGVLHVARSKFSSNSASDGGAIGVLGVDGLDVSGSTFTSNVATGIYPELSAGSGGAIASLGGDVTVAGSSFTGNTAPWAGGAVLAANSDFSVSGSTFTRNTAQSLTMMGPESVGGAIALVDGADGCDEPQWTITTSKFSGNTSTTFGGAVAAEGCDDTVGGGGYAGYKFDSSLTLDGSTFSGNSAVWGGAVAGGYLNIGVTGSTFSSNRAGEDGGAIWLAENPMVDPYSEEFAMTRYLFEDFAGFLATDSLTKFTGNRAGHEGGAVYALDASVGFSGTATGNVAGTLGGALWVFANSRPSGLEISKATIERNTARYAGGGVWFDEPYRQDGDFYIYDEDGWARSHSFGWTETGGVLSLPLSEGPVSISFNKVTDIYGVGGGIYVLDGADVQLFNSPTAPGTVTIQRNVAKYDGGGMYVEDCDLYGHASTDVGVLFAYNAKGGLFSWDNFDDHATYTGNTFYGFSGGAC